MLLCLFRGREWALCVGSHLCVESLDNNIDRVNLMEYVKSTLSDLVLSSPGGAWLSNTHSAAQTHSEQKGHSSGYPAMIAAVLYIME